jgi:hypothetical protein
VLKFPEQQLGEFAKKKTFVKSSHARVSIEICDTGTFTPTGKPVESQGPFNGAGPATQNKLIKAERWVPNRLRIPQLEILCCY